MRHQDFQPLRATVNSVKSIGSRLKKNYTNASDHHWYPGSPRRETPGDWLTVLAVSSSAVNRLTIAFARVTASFVGSQTAFSFNGGLVQSGKEYENADAVDRNNATKHTAWTVRMVR